MTRHVRISKALWTYMLREFECITYQAEIENPLWWTRQRLHNWIRHLPASTSWNEYLGVTVVLSIFYTSMFQATPELFNNSTDIERNIVNVIAAIINVSYAVTVIAIFYDDYYKYRFEETGFKWSQILWYVVDVLSFVFIPLMILMPTQLGVLYTRLTCHFMRLHRPFRFFWSRNENNLKGSVVRSVFKYIFLFIVLRIIYANIFVWIGEVKNPVYTDAPDEFKAGATFYRGFYIVTKLCIPVSPDTPPTDAVTRALYMSVMLAGCLLMKGITVASLSLIIALHLRPGDVFRQRFQLIMKEMVKTNVPVRLREKVKTFYRMYWHKQKAVSVTSLLPTFPPSLSYMIHTDIYFEAQQKSRILRDLSYQFLSEVARVMKTTNFVPGDIIVKRNSPKSSIFFISHGDVEVLTAEDDDTAILRFTRGTIINPCGGCVEIASSRSHVAVRAATFCTAHVLSVADLWQVAVKYGRSNGESSIVHASFLNHLARVKQHSATREHPTVKYKSNIVHMKRNVIALKETRDSSGRMILKNTDVFIQIAGCYLMRNREDSSLTDEADEICLSPKFPCILQPNSSLQDAWNLLVAFITVLVIVMYPCYKLFFKTISLDFKLFDYMVSFVYITDIIVHLSTGSKTEEGVPLTFSQTAARQLDNWFMLDVLSVLPIFDFIDDGRFSGMNKLFKIPKLFYTIDEIFSQRPRVRFILYCLLFLLFTWLVAAIDQFYRCFNFGTCLLTNITNEPFWAKKPLDDSPAEDRLLFTFYWAISMITFTTHKNQQSAKYKWKEQLFVIMILEICIWLHNLMEASYSATIMTTETMNDEYNTCIETVKNFLVKKKIDPELRYRFINYLQLCWYTDRAYAITHQKSSITFDLPEHVDKSILTLQRSKYVLCIPFIKFLNQEELKLVSSKARLFYTSPNEILLNTGDISNEICVIRQGYCEVLDPILKERVSLIGARKHFGDLECLLRIPAYYTVRAVTHVQIFSISRKHLMKAMSMPKIKDAITFAKQRPEFEALQAGFKPFMKYERPAPPPSRSRFPLLRKHERDDAFLEPFYSIGFFALLRYVFPRFTIRPDGPYLRHYELFRATCAFVSANIFPVYTFLSLQWPGLRYLAIFLDYAAYYDIAQRMLVAYFDANGILVYHPASTAVHYIKGALLVDLFSCLPLEYLDNMRDNIELVNDAYSHPSGMQYFMYNRIVQLYRLPHALGFLKRFIDRDDIILVLDAGNEHRPATFLIRHWCNQLRPIKYLRPIKCNIKVIPIFIALITVSTSILLEFTVEKASPLKGGWLLTKIIDPNYGSWIDRHSDVVRYNITETPFSAVLTVYFWIVYEVTTTGFNVFQPSQLDQMMVIIISMVIGSIIINYLSVHVLSIRSNVNKALATFQEDMKDMAAFMKREKLDSDLRREVISYYEYKWDKMGGTDYREVLKLCDHITLRTDAILHIYGPTFSSCPILSKCDMGLLRLIGRAVTSRYFREQMTIVELDDVIQHMYFIDFGLVTVYDAEGSEVTKLGRGSIFGNIENVRQLCPYRFISCSNMHLLKIKSDVFYAIIRDFPSVKAILKKQQLREYYISGEAAKRSSIQTERKLLLFLSFLQYSVPGHFYMILISLMVIYGDVYNAGFFVNSVPLISVLYLLDLLYVAKMVVNYYMPYVTEEDKNKENALEERRKKYIQGKFRYELMSCLPIEIFSLLHQQTWHAFAILRLNRCLRLITLNNSLQWFYNRISVNLTLLTSFAVLVWFTLFVHVVACMWHSISVYEEGSIPFSSWRYTNDKEEICDSHMYICSMYFIMTTFTQNGIGDILPRQHSEVIFVCVLMISSTMIFLIYIGEFSNMIQFQAYRWFMFYGEYKQLQAFLKNNRVSKNLVRITKKYTLHLWRESRGLQTPHFLHMAPHCLRLKIMSAAYMHHLTGHPVFQDCEPAFLRLLVGYFTQFTYTSDMFVVKQGEITNSMYFIHKGRVEQIAEDVQLELEQFHTGQYFGTAHGLQYDLPFTVSYRTVINSQVLTLCYSHWENLLKLFPKSKAIIKRGREDDNKDDYVDMQEITEKITEHIAEHIENLPLDITLAETENQGTSTQLANEHSKALLAEEEIAAPNPLTENVIGPQNASNQNQKSNISISSDTIERHRSRLEQAVGKLKSMLDTVQTAWKGNRSDKLDEIIQEEKDIEVMPEKIKSSVLKIEYEGDTNPMALVKYKQQLPKKETTSDNQQNARGSYDTKVVKNVASLLTLKPPSQTLSLETVEKIHNYDLDPEKHPDEEQPYRWDLQTDVIAGPSSQAKHEIEKNYDSVVNFITFLLCLLYKIKEKPSDFKLKETMTTRTSTKSFKIENKKTEFKYPPEVPLKIMSMESLKSIRIDDQKSQATLKYQQSLKEMKPQPKVTLSIEAGSAIPMDEKKPVDDENMELDTTADKVQSRSVDAKQSTAKVTASVIASIMSLKRYLHGADLPRAVLDYDSPAFYTAKESSGFETSDLEKSAESVEEVIQKMADKKDKKRRDSIRKLKTQQKKKLRVRPIRERYSSVSSAEQLPPPKKKSIKATPPGDSSWVVGKDPSDSVIPSSSTTSTESPETIAETSSNPSQKS